MVRPWTITAALPFAAAKDLGPVARAVEVPPGPEVAIIEVGEAGRREGHGGLDLRALVPLVVRRHADDRRPRGEGRLPQAVVGGALFAVALVVRVPGSHAQVGVTGAHARHEEQPVRAGVLPHGRPVRRGRAEREAVGREVGVGAVEAAGQQRLAVARADPQADHHGVIGRAAQGHRAVRPQQRGPFGGRRQVRVVDVDDGTTAAPVQRGVVAPAVEQSHQRLARGRGAAAAERFDVKRDRDAVASRRREHQRQRGVAPILRPPPRDDGHAAAGASQLGEVPVHRFGRAGAVEAGLRIEARPDVVRRCVARALAVAQEDLVVPVLPAAVDRRRAVPGVVERVDVGRGRRVRARRARRPATASANEKTRLRSKVHLLPAG